MRHTASWSGDLLYRFPFLVIPIRIECDHLDVAHDRDD